MSFRTVCTAVAAFAVAASAPLSAAAAVRPGSAVPAAASAYSTSAAAQNGGTNAATPWPAYAIIALTVALGVWIAVDDNKGKSISRG